MLSLVVFLRSDGWCLIAVLKAQTGTIYAVEEIHSKTENELRDALFAILVAKPFLCTFAPQDPMLGWARPWYEKNVPGTQGMPHEDIADAGHFLQEDQGPRLAEIMRRFIAEH